MRPIAVIVVALAGCLGDPAVTTENDLSATVLDFSLSPGVDLARGDGGALYNCVQLNNCEKGCASDPKPQSCIANCRTMASASALTKEMAVQACFNQGCPQATDAGTSAICTATDMGLSTTCATCIQNTQIAPANACTSVATPPECHTCYNQALDCVNDK
jgi:hypothetical protein